MLDCDGAADRDGTASDESSQCDGGPVRRQDRGEISHYRSEAMEASNLFSKARLVPQKIYELTHPSAPWLSQSAVRYLDQHLKGGIGFEWGSGRSSAWLARRLDKLTSIESDPGWYERVKRNMANLSNASIRLVDDPGERGERSKYAEPVQEISDRSLNFALIDGHHREECIVAVMPKMACGGLLAVDNTDWPTLKAFTAETIPWPIVHRSRNARTETTIWRAP